MKTLFSGLVIATAATLVAGCHSHEETQAAAVETARAALVSSAQEQVPNLIRSTGTVHAKETAVISAQVMGRIEQVLVREGDIVHAGQTLVIIDGAALNAQAAQAQAAVIAAQNQENAAQSNASLAASTLARFKQLEAEKSVSPQELDEVTRRAEGANAQLQAAKAQTEAARQQAAAAKTMQGYTRLAAPFAGVVTSRSIDPGSMAAPGSPLLQIDRMGALQLQGTIDQSAISALRVGMRAQVAIDGVPNKLQGTIAEILPAADAASHSFTIKLDLPSSSTLRAGMYGTIEIPNGTANALVVPRSSIVERGSLDCAYVLDSQGIAQLRYVTLGSVHGDRVEVLSGLAAGERLVDAPGDRELAGKRIESDNGGRP